MQKKIQLTIPKPCNEKWNSFTSTAQGGFCGSCQKEVIDFTNWSEERLKAYFQKPPSNACGRFKEQQLKVYTVGQKHSSVRWLSFAFAGVLLLFSSRPVVAQVGKVKVVAEEVERKPFMGDVMVMSKSDSTIIISGVVTYGEDGSTLPGVNVVCKRTSERTVTDADGKYTLTLKKFSASETIAFDFIGMTPEEVMIDKNRMLNAVDVVMLPDMVLSGEVIVVGGICMRPPWYSPRRWWQGIRSWF